MPSFYGSVPVLRIFDQTKTHEFYVDFLGFTFDWQHGGGEAPLFAQISLGTCVIQLSEHFGDAAPGGQVKIRTDGLDSYQQTLLAKNYRHARPGIETQTWGAREMMISDPFFNRLIFWEPLQAR